MMNNAVGKYARLAMEMSDGLMDADVIRDYGGALDALCNHCRLGTFEIEESTRVLFSREFDPASPSGRALERLRELAHEDLRAFAEEF